MYKPLKIWLKAFRLRTLPLALSSTFLGSFMAYSHEHFSWMVFLFAVLTTLSLQILSNLANDYGDAKKRN
jgi:1,4-dihydroxy-2-naphthoate octaprenyltransferase